MRALIVHGHPDPSSFNRALVDSAVTGLEQGGHTCEVLDLYALGYTAGMSRSEHLAYASADPILDPMVAGHARSLTACEVLVFVYPTWWGSVPAIVKGWIERTLVPGLAFGLDERTGRISPVLTQIRHIVGITTYGSPRWYVKVINDAGRRSVLRSLRMCTGVRTKTTWLPLYDLDGITESERARFLGKVNRSMAKLR